MLRSALTGLFLCCIAGAALADKTAPLPVQAFFSNPKVSSAKISPDGKYLALVVSDADSGEERTLLTIIDSERKIKTGFKVTDGHEIWNYWWANDGRVLIATSVQTGALSYATPDGAVYGINIDSTQQLQLLGQKAGTGNVPQKKPDTSRTEDPAQDFTHISHTPHATKPEAAKSKTYYFSGMVFDPQDDSNHVLVEGRAEDSERMQVLKVDVMSGDVDVVTTSPTDGGGFFVDADGKVRIAWGVKKSDGLPQAFYRGPGDSAPWQDLSALYKNLDPAGDDTGPIGMAQDGKAIYWRGRTADGTMGLFTVDPADMSERSLYADPALDTSGFIYGDFAGNDHKILAVNTFPDMPELHVIDPQDPETKVFLALRQAFPDQYVFITSASRDGTAMVVYVGSDRNPGDYYLFNGKTLKADYLFSTLEDIDPDKMAPMRPIAFQARDGLTLHGYLTAPLGVPAKGLPLIVLPHGGPHQIRDYWGWNPEAQFFANHGYAVLQVNYRGSVGYGMKFQDMGYRHWGTTMQDDLADAVRWATQQGIADRSRVCIYGASYGGYAALENVIRYPDLYQCAAGYVGVYDLTLQGKYSDTERFASGRRYLDTVLGGDQKELKEYSPAYHADGINVPVFIAYGGKDQRVVPDNARELMAAMDDEGKKYELLFDPYEDHGFKKPADRFELYDRMLKFFDAHIGPQATKQTASSAPQATANNH